MNISELYDIYKRCGCRVTTDTRTLEGGELFFALKGENFDGNEYALKALESGAAFAVVDADSYVGTACVNGDFASLSCKVDLVEDGVTRIIPVDNTLVTLQQLASWHRSHLLINCKPLTVISLTGTNGKTTTKELIREVLSVKYNVTATEGNLNNNIGVPLTLLKINDKTQISVVEMGASHPGDIKELVDIALPDYGLITNVGKAHLLGFGSFVGVMNTKAELYDFISAHSGKIFLNVDNQYLCKMAYDRGFRLESEDNIIPYGVAWQDVEVLPSSAECPFLRLLLPLSDGEVLPVNTNLIGTYNADNIMAALSVGSYFGVSLKDAVGAINAYVPSNNRSQMTKTEKNVVIVDAYNANPTSMAAALNNFATVRSDKKIVLLGDMLELGEESVNEHVAVIRKLLDSELFIACLVGDEFAKAVSVLKDAGVEIPYSVLNFKTSDELLLYLENQMFTDSVILVKGSRGTRMEKVMDAL